MTLPEPTAPAARSIDDKGAGLRAHVLALGLVAAAVVARFGLGFTGADVPFAIFYAAVAVSAINGGWPPAVVAMLTALLVARVSSDVSLLQSIAFVFEALVIAAVTIRVGDSLRLQRARTAAADELVRELKASEQQHDLVGAAFNRLQEACTDAAVVLLDETGQIRDWGIGAERLYRTADGLNQRATALFSPSLTEEEFGQLLSAARREPVRRRVRLRRGDDTEFEADCEIARLIKGRFSGFTMVVADQSRQLAWDAFAQSAADTESVLREEADVAQRQLAALKDVTDPSLDLGDRGEVLATLLNRLRPVVGADGIALTAVGDARTDVVYASDGLRGSDAGRQDAVARRHQHQPGHTLLIHNDAHRVAEMSVVSWPEDVASLIAVPVVRTGATLAVLEVVYLRGRRSTEWEIALIQVVAARIAGMLGDDAGLTMRGQDAVHHFA
jgi:GAF domain-containing protein